MQKLGSCFILFVLSVFWVYANGENRESRLMSVYNMAFNTLMQRGDVKRLIDFYHLDYVALDVDMTQDGWVKRKTELKTGSDVESILKENEEDALARVLKSKEVRVGALRNKNWGNIGNYTVDNPTGFWPDLMRLVWREISFQYFKDENAIKVTYKMYNNVFNALELQNIDMTDNFFLFYKNPESTNMLRNEKLVSKGSPVISHTNKFILLKKHNINDFNSFKNFISNNRKSVIGCLTRANCNIFKNRFGDHVKFVYDKFYAYEDLIKSVEEEKITAGVVSGLDMSIIDLSKFSIIESPISTLHVPYFQASGCVSYFSSYALMAVFTLIAVAAFL